MASPVESVSSKRSAPAHTSAPARSSAAATRSSAPEKTSAAPSKDRVTLSAEVSGAEAAAKAGGVPNLAAAYGGSTHPAVAKAREFVGQNAIDVKGELPNFDAPGGQTNNCAAFVTANLFNSGDLSRTEMNVRELEKMLPTEGYHKVPAEQARSGDIWIAKQGSHTELVSTDGGLNTIGSNNDRKNHQIISERSKDPDAGYYWQKQEPQTLMASAR